MFCVHINNDIDDVLSCRMVTSREFHATDTEIASYTLLNKKCNEELVKDGRILDHILDSYIYFILEKIF